MCTGKLKSRCNVIDHRRSIIARERDGKIEIRVDIVATGADHPPFIAEEAKPFHWLEAPGIFGERADGFRCVLRKIVAAAPRVDEQVVASRCPQGLRLPLDDLTTWLTTGRLEAGGKRPTLDRHLRTVGRSDEPF